MKIFFSIATIFLIFLSINKLSNSHDNIQAEISNDITQLTPGKTLRIEIPQLLSNDNKQRICEVRIPENFRLDENVPLLVWFSPGPGSNSIHSIPPIVDKSKYLLLALPYPDNQLPRLAIKAGKIDRFWDYQKPMLEYIKEMFPNIDPNIKIAAGFSSGSHLIGSGLDRDWSGFTDFFTVYILHEGGGSPDMKFKGAKSTHNILVTYGLQNNSYGKVVEREMKRSGIMPDVIKLPNTGHSMSQESINAIKQWIDAL